MRFQRKLRRESVATMFVAALFIIIISVPETDVSSPAGGVDVIPETGQEVPVTHPYEIVVLDYDDAPYSYDDVTPLAIDYPTDDDGVIMRSVHGENYYHPVQISQKILHYLDAYIKTEKVEYLNRSILFADKLVEIAEPSGNSLFLPYTFKNQLHGNPDAILKAPWYSGMAQGQALSAFIRLYRITNDENYLDVAERLFASLSIMKDDVDQGEPWVSCIDDEGYYWIEEYPFDEPCHVLNGFVFAIYGLYDYYMLTSSEECLQLMRSSITTVADHMDEYRNEGNVSCYELRWRVRVPKYHHCHIKQMEMLGKITGDLFFSGMQEILKADFYEEC